MTPADPFDDLEGRLRRRPMPALPPGLRDRVVAEAAPAAERAPVVDWRFAASLAAGVLVALNVAAMVSNLTGAPVVPRLFPPPGASVASTDSPTVAPRLGSPWLPCDLPGAR